MTDAFAMVFPGQGSQSTGMLKELAEKYSTIQEVFDFASSILDVDLWAITQTESLQHQLNETTYTQPIMLTADVAVYQCWQRCHGNVPAIVAGHSLGEYSALVCADVLPFEQALLLVVARAKYMTEAAKGYTGAMAAIIGLDVNTIETLCMEASQKGYVAPANFNSIGQTVVAGEEEPVKAVIDLAKLKGAKIAKIIPVSIPSHCALMKSAAMRLESDLASVQFSQPSIPILHNVDATTHAVNDIKNVLVLQMTQAVQWVKTIEAFKKYHIKTVIECGPGKVLSGLNKRVDKSLNYHMTFDRQRFDEALKVVNV